MSRTFNLVVFGATGFTGKFVVENIAKLLRDKKTDPFTWAVAGRSLTKLRQVLKEASGATGDKPKQHYLILYTLITC
jgi:short subunit dehydrogenase-like uncharacterized protein